MPIREFTPQELDSLNFGRRTSFMGGDFRFGVEDKKDSDDANKQEKTKDMKTKDMTEIESLESERHEKLDL